VIGEAGNPKPLLASRGLAHERSIDFRDDIATLKAGEMLVAPRGVEHKPRAAEVCHVMLVEPGGTLDTGDAGGDRTVAAPEWI